jgi:hypothetical protein
MNLTERISLIEHRLNIIEEYLGINIVKTKISSINIEKEDDEKINGFTKSQLRVMFHWAKDTELEKLTENDFNELKKWKMLKELFPNSPDNYKDIKRN